MHKTNIIRCLMICEQLANVIIDPMDTCSVMLHALDTVYHNQIVPETKLHYLHPNLIKQYVYDVVEASILESNPHLEGLMQIVVEQDSQESYIMDVFVSMKSAQLHLQEVNEVTNRIH